MKRTTVDDLTARQCGFATLSRQLLTTWQFDRLRATLRATAASPFYRRHLAAVDPKTIQRPADLSSLPFVTAETLCTEGLRLQCLSAREVSRIITLQTSGSTGQPKRLAFTAAELAATCEFFRIGMDNLLAAGETVLVLLPAERPDSVGDLLRRSLPQDGHPTVTLWPPEPAKVQQVVAASGAASVIGLPQHLLMMAEDLPPGHRVRTVLLNSDYAPAALRRRIEARGITTFVHYGATESGFGGGVECDAHHGCHLREAELLVEIVDPESGQPVPAGEPGEIVFTTLLRRAMPLIRYRTGDFARLLTSRCRCGGITARLEGIHRRQSVTLANGATVAGHQLDELLFAVPGLLDYRATLCTDGIAIDYLAAADIAATCFPPAPGEVCWSRISREKEFGDRHPGKRLLRDCRKG